MNPKLAIATNNGKKSKKIGLAGLALIAAAILLTPLNEGTFLFIKRFLLVAGYLLCIASTIFTLIDKRVELKNLISRVFHEAGFAGLLVFQMAGGLIACLIFDGSYFALFFGGACCGSLAWWLLAKK
ncbi:hypothetical protein [Allofranklinella schreckenbergeri]|uniref:hypothetical protein n=1 Tax=Allofranklinella schreckenbergeri TaxID=1076744 RepID=UPI0011C3B407|nr:hypothetical protein [Allofranklinella schreckenbergeri]